MDYFILRKLIALGYSTDKLGADKFIYVNKATKN
jgi:hypothetical protein